MNRVGGGRKVRSLDKTPVFREMVFETDEMWSLQSSRSFKITPKNLVEWTLIMGTPSIEIAEGETEDLFDLLKNIQREFIGFKPGRDLERSQ